MTKKSKIITIFALVFTLLLVIVLFAVGFITLQGFCGFDYEKFMPEYSGRVAKVWECSCIGLKEVRSTSYTKEVYCTGINISNPDTFRLFNPTLQHPMPVVE